MAIAVKELKVNDIVLAPNKLSNRGCIVKAIHDDIIAVDYYDTLTCQMDYAEISSKDLEPIALIESVLYALGFRETPNKYYSSPLNKCYILKKKGQMDVVVIRTDQWHLLILRGNSWYIDKRVLFLHTLQNYLSKDKENADAVSHDLFFKLTKPQCILPFEPIEK
jgi:hypothetical protein